MFVQKPASRRQIFGTILEELFYFLEGQPCDRRCWIRTVSGLVEVSDFTNEILTGELGVRVEIQVVVVFFLVASLGADAANGLADWSGLLRTEVEFPIVLRDSDSRTSRILFRTVRDGNRLNRSKLENPDRIASRGFFVCGRIRDRKPEDERMIILFEDQVTEVYSSVFEEHLAKAQSLFRHLKAGDNSIEPIDIANEILTPDKVLSSEIGNVSRETILSWIMEPAKWT